MKKAFVAHGVNMALYRLIEGEEELRDAAEAIGFSVIIKPFRFRGKRWGLSGA